MATSQNIEGKKLAIYRRAQAAQAAGNGVLKKAAFMGFGDGGHSADGTPKPIDIDVVDLFQRRLVVPLESLVQPDYLRIRARATFNGTALSRVSEAMLFDEDMQPMCMSTFQLKQTTPGETYAVTLLMPF